MLDVLKKVYEKSVLRVLRFIGLINSIILLSLFYYLILGPMAVIRKILLLLKGGGGRERSYWREREESDLVTELRRQF